MLKIGFAKLNSNVLAGKITSAGGMKQRSALSNGHGVLIAAI